MTALAPHLSAYLEQYLPRDCRASLHTVDSYALTFELLLDFAQVTIPRRACSLEIEELTPQLRRGRFDDAPDRLTTMLKEVARV